MADDQDPILSELAPVELIRAVERPDGAARLRALAAKELARRDPGAAMPLLARVVRDEAAPADLRSVAAVMLGKQAGAESEAALTAALTAEEPLVVRRAAEGLGRIGDREALAALKRTPMPADPAAARSLRFARSLVAYRLGLNEELIAAPPPAPVTGRSEPLSVAPAPAQVRNEVMERLPRALPGIAVRAEAAVQIACTRNEMLVLPANEAASIRRASAVAAVVMKRAHSLGYFATHLYILSHPAERDQIALVGVRPDGTITHRGEAWLDAAGVRFSLTAVAAAQADPVEIEGVLGTDGAIDISSARVSADARRGAVKPRRNDAPTLAHPLTGKASIGAALR